MRNISEICKQCGWHEISCASCHGTGGLQGWINFKKEEVEDLLSNLKQCESEGYLEYGDPAYSAMEKLQNLVEGFK